MQPKQLLVQVQAAAVGAAAVASSEAVEVEKIPRHSPMPSAAEGKANSVLGNRNREEVSATM